MQPSTEIPTAPYSSEAGRIECPACNQPVSKPLAQIHYSRSHQVFRCASCGLEFIDPFLPNNAEETSAVTGQDYRQEMLSRHAKCAPLIAERADRRLAFYQELLGYKPRRILDVGAGTGWMVKAYQDRGIDAVGLEFDVEFVRQATAIGANVMQGDICQIDMATMGEFDVVCSSQTYEHILQPQRALQKMVSLLSIGGILRVDVPNADSWGARVRRYRHGKHNWGVICLPYHQLGFKRRTFEYLFEHNGLQILEISEQPTDHPIHGQTILPSAWFSRVAIQGSKLLGHGYLLVGVGRKIKQPASLFNA